MHGGLDMKLKKAYNYLYIAPTLEIGMYFVSIDTVAKPEKVATPDLVALLSLCLRNEEGKFELVSEKMFRGIQRKIISGLSEGYEVRVGIRERKIEYITSMYTQEGKDGSERETLTSVLKQPVRPISFSDGVLSRIRR